ncbi:nicotinate phosphoribosyltransferase, partial [Archaeoglobus sp.]
MRFLIVDDEDIRYGLTTDKYFLWTEQVLKAKGVNPKVVAEVTTSSWGIFVGINDVLKLLEGKPVDVYAMPEGCLFFPHEPVITIVGRYLDFARFETAILGFICHPSAVATEAFKFKLASGDKRILSFGTRRMHPAISAVIERSAYIGGVDGVSNVSAEKYLGIKSIGTMPHALIICFGDQVEAWRAYDEVVDENVPRIMLIDTYYDEKTEAVLAVENVDRVDGVRLDTPSSRRGNMRKIVEEVRWELDIRGRRDVKIVVSGGLSLKDVIELRDLVDAFGVGTAIAGAKPIDFAMDIVEREGKFVAKRGKRG